MKYTNKFNTTLIALTVVVAGFGFAAPAQAFTYDKNFIISDAEMTNTKAVSTSTLNTFMKSKGSIMTDYKVQDDEDGGKTKTIAQMMVDAGKKNGINPMVLLVMSQKESSAVSKSKMDSSVQNWMMGYGVCDGCSLSHLQAYKGISNQINGTAWQLARYMERLKAGKGASGESTGGWRVNYQKRTGDGIVVTPSNNATAALYAYNPYVGKDGGGSRSYGANSLFAKLWREWNPSTKYPDGSLLQINGTVYLIENGTKRAFTSKGALSANYNPKNVIKVPATVGGMYKTGRPISYPNYSVLKSPKGTVFLTVGDTRRGFTSMKAFKSAGFFPEEMINATWRDINAYKEGPKITEAAKYPGGALIRNSKTKQISWVAPNGEYRRTILSEDILRTQFGNAGNSIMVVSEKEYNSFKKKPDMKLADGTLMTKKGAKSVYIVSGGKRLPFDSRETFEALGYKWSNIIVVNDKVFNLHPQGDKISLGNANVLKKSVSCSPAAARAFV